MGRQGTAHIRVPTQGVAGPGHGGRAADDHVAGGPVSYLGRQWQWGWQGTTHGTIGVTVQVVTPGLSSRDVGDGVNCGVGGGGPGQADRRGVADLLIITRIATLELRRGFLQQLATWTNKMVLGRL